MLEDDAVENEMEDADDILTDNVYLTEDEWRQTTHSFRIIEVYDGDDSDVQQDTLSDDVAYQSYNNADEAVSG